MFKISDFSKICQVSARMLRHYDEIGLFKPAHIDRFTGYRYYTIEQLPQLNRILALKDMGLSLEEVKHMLDDNLSAAEIRGMLRLKQAELRQHIAEERARLARVESRLQQIEQEGSEPQYDVILKPIETQRVLSLREVSPSLRDMGIFLEEIYYAGLRSGVKDLGHCLAVFYDAEFDEQQTDWEVGFPVGERFNGTIRVDDRRCLTVRELPNEPLMACTIYQGSYIGLHHGYSALGGWIESSGYRIAGKAREVFLRMGVLEEPSNPAMNMTEIQFPVERTTS